VNAPAAFNFSAPTQVVHGQGASNRAGELAERLGARRVFAVVDPGVAQVGVLTPALDSIRAAGLELAVYDRTQTDPTVADIGRVAVELLEFGADCVVAAGGGSGLCTGRAAALAATNGGSVRECLGHDRYLHDPLPVIAVPTTAGSGSEVSKHTTLSDETTGRKTGIDGFSNAPRFALLDPELVQTVPRTQALASGIDAFLHALEAFLSTRASPITDAIALDAFQRIWTALPRALEGDREARAAMLPASTMANIACGNAGLTLIHAMNGGVTYCYRLRGHQPVPYGLIHGALMPPILRFYLPAARDRFARLAPLVGAESPEAAVEAIISWALAMGAPQVLPWGRIPDVDLDVIVEETLARPRPSPRQAGPDELRAIMLTALGEGA
jgi:alcohol dehydrogenase class IV